MAAAVAAAAVAVAAAAAVAVAVAAVAAAANRSARGFVAALRGFWASLKRIARGDVGPIVDRMDRQIARAEEYVDSVDDAPRRPEHGPARPRRDRSSRRTSRSSPASRSRCSASRRSSSCPSIPFAPGHKLVLLTPLYIVATLRTRTRFGATLTGLVMGSVAFLLGDGRYGIFEILKHVTPGHPLRPLRAAHGAALRRPAARELWRGRSSGGLMGLGRFATIFTITLAVQAPAVAWAFLVPGLIIHTTFGVLSGLVSSPLIRALAPRPRDPASASM